MIEKDFIAQLFNVRRERYGISDDVYWGWFDPKTKEITWKTWRHAETDGLGGIANILRPLGFPCSPLPVNNDPQLPSWFEIIRASRKFSLPKSPKVVNWKQTYSYDPSQLHLPEVVYLSREQTNNIKKKAAITGVSAGNLIFSTLSRIIAQRLIEGDTPFYWFIPVNVRGACGIRNEQFNQASGVNIMVHPDSQAPYWQEQMKLALNSKSHWATWRLANMGKYVGDHGLSLLYKVTSRSTHFAGSCSNMGEWPLSDERNAEVNDHKVLSVIGPGTANYPINASLLGWNGAYALTLKLHPYICPNQSNIRELADAWHSALIS